MRFPLLCGLLALYVSGMACATGDVAQPEKSTPHIALLLPLNSPSLGPSAKSVAQGFQAAASVQTSDLPIRVYSDFNESSSVVTAYRSAIANGAVAVVGPLTRDGIHQLVEEKNIPVLLNFSGITDVSLKRLKHSSIAPDVLMSWWMMISYMPFMIPAFLRMFSVERV